MSEPPASPAHAGVLVQPPTPSHSAPLPSHSPRPADARSTALPAPPRGRRNLDSGVALEEVVKQALTLDTAQGEDARRELEQREEAAVARKSAASSPHSSAEARSAGGNGSTPAGGSSHHPLPQRPSPSSGRGSFGTYSSRSPNSRTSSGSNPHEFHSSRSSFDRRGQGTFTHQQQHALHLSPPSQSGGWSYAPSPTQRTPASDMMYPLPAFYPSSAFYYPPSAGTPAYVAYRPFTSPLPSPHVDFPGAQAALPFAGGFPFSSAPVSQGYAVYQSAPATGAYPIGPVPIPVQAAEGSAMYDDAGNVVKLSTAAEQAQQYPTGGEYQQHHYAAYFHQQQQQVGYAPIPPQMGGPYQPVYFAPPQPPPAPSHPQQQQQQPPAPANVAPAEPPQPLSYPISSATTVPPPPQSDSASTAASTYPVYPIQHRPPAPPQPQPAPPAQPEQPPLASYAFPPPQQQQQQQTLIPPPPPPPLGLAYPPPFSSHPVPPSHLPPPHLSPQSPTSPFAPPPFLSTHSRESSGGLTHLTSASSGSAVSSGPPRVYEPPSTPARGQLAREGLRQAAAAGVGSPDSARGRGEGGLGGQTGLGERRSRERSAPGGPVGGGAGQGMGPQQQQQMRRDLPKPPPHSPHALWVGNVPSDVSHAELWQFFQTRPVPSACGVLPEFGRKDLNLDVTGIESIHLIARSNCAFVNYTSNLHLQHAILVSNGLSLRPGDPRCKAFVCRERKHDDDVKSGVGAQRVGGLHRSYIREQRERMLEGQRALAAAAAGKEGGEGEGGAEVTRRQSVVSSVGSGSTTSSFLSKHFERRYFILKSHDEADLRLSVETGLWATQAHNEPVLQQAYRTSKAVYLIFGANGQGCWFGVAKMAGPISTAGSSTGSRPSISSREGSLMGGASSSSTGGAQPSTLLSAPSQIIHEEGEAATFPERPKNVLYGESERHFATASPSPLIVSPSAAPLRLPHAGGAESAPATLAPRQPGDPNLLPPEASARHHRRESEDVPPEVRAAMSIEADLVAREMADNLHLPEAVVAKRAATFDDAVLLAKEDIGNKVEELEVEKRERRSTLEVEAERRNRRLEGMEDRTEAPRPVGIVAGSAPHAPARQGSATANAAAAWGTPFAVEWIKVNKIPFQRTKIRNSFNGNREVKVSRDGTEVEPAAGEALLATFWEGDPSGVPSLSPTTALGGPPPLAPASIFPLTSAHPPQPAPAPPPLDRAGSSSSPSGMVRPASD
ncbi:hypothetical protein JCM8547_003021 [Rhodosporidiobolus lusitaniae]